MYRYIPLWNVAACSPVNLAAAVRLGFLYHRFCCAIASSGTAAGSGQPHHPCAASGAVLFQRRAQRRQHVALRTAWYLSAAKCSKDYATLDMRMAGSSMASSSKSPNSTSRQDKSLASLSSSVSTPSLPSWSSLLAARNPYGEGSRRTRMLDPKSEDYGDLCERFEFPRPKHYNIGVDIVDKHVELGRGGRTALICEHEDGSIATRTYAQLLDLSNRLCNVLVSVCKVARGDRVALLMSQSFETAVAHAAVYKIAAIAVPLFVLFEEEALQYRLQDSGARVVIVEPHRVDTVERLVKGGRAPGVEHIIVADPVDPHAMLMPWESTARPHSGSYRHHGDEVGRLSMSVALRDVSATFSAVDTAADDPALIIYTSGTTGSPKGALHAHRVLLGHLPGVEFPHNFFPCDDDVFWTPADWAWIGGLIDVLLPAMHHGVPVLAHRTQKFDAAAAFHLIARHRVRNMFLPPTALKMMRNADLQNAEGDFADLCKSVRSVGAGGEALGDELLDWGERVFGVTVNEFYGQTECNLVVGNCSSVLPVRRGSMGRAVPGHDVRIVDPSNGSVISEPDRVGCIGVRSPDPVMMIEYWNKPAATQEKYAGDFLLTGDLGRMDKDGYFWFVGRDDDVITSSGYRIGPSEIESCLLRHPAVANVAAVGVPDDVRGEVVKVFVVLSAKAKAAATGAGGRGDATFEQTLKRELQEFVKNRLAKYEYPREVEFIEELPLTTTGKVIRRVLKEREIEKYENEKE